MKVMPQAITVFSDPITAEVNVVLAGLRISLTADEASHLNNDLTRCLEGLRGTPRKSETSAVDAFSVSRQADAAAAREPSQDILSKAEWPRQ